MGPCTPPLGQIGDDICDGVSGGVNAVARIE